MSSKVGSGFNTSRRIAPIGHGVHRRPDQATAYRADERVSDAPAHAPHPGSRGQHRPRRRHRVRRRGRRARPARATPRRIEGLLLIGLAVRQRGAAQLAAAAPPARAARAACVETMSASTSPRPASAPTSRPAPPREVQRLTADFNRMLARLEQERRESGRAVLRAQEEERARIAQDLHDEVNQALTAILLRLQADDAPTRRPACATSCRRPRRSPRRRWRSCCTLARQLRPTALDDHGLVPALASQVADFGERTGIRSRFTPPRRRCRCSPTRSSSCIYRVTQESLSNVVQHAGASARRRRALLRRAHRPARPRRRLRLHEPSTATAAPASASPACASARCSSAAA